MSMSERVVCDQDVRDRVAGDLSTTFLLEAGAGTGKTRVLVDRYVRCVLDEELGSGDVRTVAAITFTEKAAGELRQRVREEFEARAAVKRKAREEAEKRLEKELAAHEGAKPEGEAPARVEEKKELTPEEKEAEKALERAKMVQG